LAACRHAAAPWSPQLGGATEALGSVPVGIRLPGRISEDAARRFFAGLFLAIGITFFLTFTVFVW